MAPPADATVFDLAPGAQQGRIQRADGTWVYELGHAARTIDLAMVGDTVTLTQVLRQDEYHQYLRALVRVRAPVPRPGGEGDEWLFTASREDVAFYERVIPADGVARELRDIVLPLRGASGQSGEITIHFALKLLGKVA